MVVVNKKGDTTVTVTKDEMKQEEDLETKEMVTVSEEGVPVDSKEEAIAETEMIEVVATETETAGEVIVEVGDKTKDMGTRTK